MQSPQPEVARPSDYHFFFLPLCLRGQLSHVEAKPPIRIARKALSLMSHRILQLGDPVEVVENFTHTRSACERGPVAEPNLNSAAIHSSVSA